MPLSGYKHTVGMTKATDAIAVQTGFHGDDHAWLENRIVSNIKKRSLMSPNPYRVTGVVPPQRLEFLPFEATAHCGVDLGARGPGSDQVDGEGLHILSSTKQVAGLSGRRTDDHGALEFAMIAPDDRTNLSD